jgi:hypothetical protein
LRRDPNFFNRQCFQRLIREHEIDNGRISAWSSGYFSTGAAILKDERQKDDETQQHRENTTTLGDSNIEAPGRNNASKYFPPTLMNQTVPTNTVTDRSRGRHFVKKHRVLDAVMKALSLKTDAGLARMLDVSPPVISLLRSGKRPIGPSMLIRMHEASDMPISQLRALMADEAQSRET